MKETIFIDLDDTCVSTQPLYVAAKESFVRAAAEQGWNGIEALALLEEIDLTSAVIPARGCDCREGPMQHRFRSSMERAAAMMALRQTGKLPDQALLDRFYGIPDSVYQNEALPLPGAIDALLRLAEEYGLYLYTMGDPEVQQMRIAHLRAHFDPASISPDERIPWPFTGCIVAPKKTPQVLMQAMASRDLRPRHTWMIGNSPRSDIMPAHEVGLRCVLVEGGWAYDSQGAIPDGVWRYKDLAEAANFLLANARETKAVAA